MHVVDRAREYLVQQKWIHSTIMSSSYLVRPWDTEMKKAQPHTQGAHLQVGRQIREQKRTRVRLPKLTFLFVTNMLCNLGLVTSVPQLPHL